MSSRKNSPNIFNLSESFKHSVTFKVCGDEGNGKVIDPVTGKYDGKIGCVQRGETDSSNILIRTDSTPFEPGYFVTFTGMSDTPRIYGKASVRISSETHDILYLWTNFETVFWLYFFIALNICTAIFLMREHVASKSSLILFKRLGKNYLKWNWRYFLLFWDADGYPFPTNSPAIILFFSIVLAMFYGIQMVLMNTLSSDLVVSTSTREIESLRDLLYDPAFQTVTPFISDYYNMYNVLHSSRPNTDESMLFKVLTERGIIIRKASDFEESIIDVAEGRKVLIENSEAISMAGRHYWCNKYPKVWNMIVVSKEPISPSPYSYLISKKFDRNIRVLLEYRIQTVGELGILQGTVEPYIQNLYEQYFGVPEDMSQTLICEQKWKGERQEDLDLPWEPFRLTPFHRLIIMCFWIIATAMVVLVLETVLKAITKTVPTILPDVLAKESTSTQRANSLKLLCVKSPNQRWQERKKSSD